MKKKIIACAFFIFLAFSITACGNIDGTTTKEPVVTTVIPTVTPTVTPTATPTTAPSTKPTPQPTTSKGSFDTPEIPAVSGNYPRLKKTNFNNYLKKDGPLTEEMFPSLGENNLLVIPVNLKTSNKTQELLDDINIAFNGTESQTGWHSVNSYYLESSYGKLNIKANVLNEWFTPSKSASYYDSYYDDSNGDYGSTLILREALAYYETKIDYSIYDNDKDGIIDSVWLIYNYDVNYDDDQSDYWAYVYWNVEADKYDGLEAYTYGFAGTDFMYEETNAYDNSKIIVDAHTFIHETGHMMGLDDYYDYDTTTGESEGGMYFADMMDGAIGDHSPISKLLLGWISPTVVTGTGSIDVDLNNFASTGDVLLISDHEVQSIYDEYFLIEFYTNDGLNFNDKPIYPISNEQVKGIRVLHVSAQKYYNSYGEVDWNPDESYSSGFLYNNSGTNHKFVSMLRADYSNSVNSYLLTNSLFGLNSKIFGQSIYSNYKYYSGSSLNFSFNVKSISNTSATITLTLK